MSTRRALALAFAVAILAGTADAAKKPAFLKKTGSAEAPAFPVVRAAEPCANWAWAAAAQSVLALDGMSVDQRVLIQKIFGGELCLDDGLDLRAMGEAVAGEYVLGPKRKMKVVARVFAAGTPLGAEDLIAAIRRGRPMIVFWRGRAYLAVGAAYVEYVGPNGQRVWEVTQLTLLDPAATGEHARQVTYVKERDGLGGFGGAMEFALFPVQELDWSPETYHLPHR